jgi:2,4-dienoyl-CoA reductase-like NADH-dependent reductase (Old Yellow Enzyme family)
MPGMQRGWCKDGAPLPQLADYYRRRVDGGTALIISESLAVDHISSTQQPTSARLNADTLEGWAGCVRAVKSAGGCMLLQLWHEGALRREGGDGPYSKHPTVSPSGIVYGGRPNGKAASADDLDAIRDGFVRSARYAKQAGADGIEIHACHGYLLDQFLWAETNRRDDGYGGEDIACRVRLPAEIAAEIRATCGPEFVISFRYSQWKEADYDARVARSPAELETMLAILRGAGVDVFHASSRRFWKPEWPEAEHGGDRNFAGWSKAVGGGLPVITVGSVGLSVDVMETLFGQEAENHVEQGVAELVRRFTAGEFDLVAIGRGLIGDPDWVNKVRAGRYADVRPFARDDLGKLEWDTGFVEEAHGRASSPR